MFKKIKKVKKIIDYIAIVGVFYILLYQFEQTRLLCKGMCKNIQCLSLAKKYKLYKSSINKSLHFAQRRLSSSTRG